MEHRFHQEFHKVTGFPPLSWQSRLYEDYFSQGRLPTAIDIPTGLGKTSVMAIWYIARKLGASLPRRLVYVVDRRAVVDQATDEAKKIRANVDDEKLSISTLRGQFADNKEWMRDPSQAAIIVGTVDMIGSRLLFQGYGVSRRMRPYHAGLLGSDTLVVLDESHLVPPFERLLDKISSGICDAELGGREEADRNLIPVMRLLPLSATGGYAKGTVFRLADSDSQDETVSRRLNAKKALRVAALEDSEKLEHRLAHEAWHITNLGQEPARVLVYSNSREVAARTKIEIEKLAMGDKKQGIAPVAIETELFVGSRRVREREVAKERLSKLGFFSSEDSSGVPAFLIATSAGEVGVDLDADHIVMDAAPFERIVQRLGRVNRLGAKESRVVIVEESSDEPRPGNPTAPTPQEQQMMLAWKALQALRYLPEINDTTLSASPADLANLRAEKPDTVKAATTPPPLYPALTRPLAEAWSMTSLREHPGRPEVNPWLRGWVEERPQMTVIWRRHLPVRSDDQPSANEVNTFFAAAPPHLLERLETETYHVQDTLKKILKRSDKHEQGVADDEIIGFILDSSNELQRRFTLQQLRDATASKQDFEREVSGNTLVLDARLGGLSNEGLLDGGQDASPPTADTQEAWMGASGEPAVPFRVRKVLAERPDETFEAADSSGWRSVFTFDLRRDAEGNPTEQLLVDKWRNDDSTEDAKSIASREQTLAEHQAWAAKRAELLVTRLNLPPELAEPLILATSLHDEGKQSRTWQDAFHAPRTGRPYAKTKGRRPPDFKILAGYRHELGSLAYVERNADFSKLPRETQDLVLHLVAAHHGHARPTIATSGADEPPSQLRVRACDVALRFAALQDRYGPWGLAWLEAILRAADQQASRDLDEGRDPNG